MTKRVILAYSGGLDTSVAIGWIAEQTGAEVIAVAMDVGQGGENMATIRERALACGAADAEVVDAREEFAADYCLPAIKANALYMNRYDQVRFEVGLASLAPEVTVLAPVRDSGMTRDKAIAFAEEKGLPIDVTHRSPYSIDQNLWGRSCETGHLEDIWEAPHDDVWAYTEDPGVPRDPDGLVLSFADGVPVAIDGVARSPLSIITELNARAGAHGVGRVDMVEDRLVGIKSREIYEAPAAIALIAAHSELESVCMELDLARFKRAVEQRWTELVYDGLWYSPLKRALDAFLAEASRHVTGDVRLRLHGGQAVVTGRRSPVSLYDHGLATYDTGDTFDQGLARGFVELWGLPSKTAALRDQRVGD